MPRDTQHELRSQQTAPLAHANSSLTHQVGIGESTCSGVFGTNAIGHGGKALFSIDSLSYIAMERASTSRAAVQVVMTT